MTGARSFATLAHNLTAADADEHVWRPDIFGSILFLVSSAFAISVLGVGFGGRGRGICPGGSRGSVAFMVSAIAGFVVPSTGAVLDLTFANAGTLVGAVCFLVGAALMLPAWRAEVRSRSTHPAK